MSELKIQRNVPRVAGKRSRKTFAFPFSKMKVNDSFLLPLDGEPLQRVRMRVYQSAWRAGFSVTTATEGDGLRVWMDGLREPKK